MPAVTAADLGALPEPATGWPRWVFEAPYDAARHPGAAPGGGALSPESGANCQLYAYGVLGLLGRTVPPHRSSELWEDPALGHPPPADVADLDLVLFASEDRAFGAHVGIVLGGGVLHLCREIGVPALWGWEEFAARERYSVVVGRVRVPADPSIRG
ncbi:hydrolase [Brachybacterium phenoliresistens]|uniref:hydrolase n=1 Tax=Brachybacterium phenoliresistens TaxID=396014 RepID=UPI0031DB779D